MSKMITKLRYERTELENNHEEYERPMVHADLSKALLPTQIIHTFVLK